MNLEVFETAGAAAGRGATLIPEERLAVCGSGVRIFRQRHFTQRRKGAKKSARAEVGLTRAVHFWIADKGDSDE